MGSQTWLVEAAEVVTRAGSLIQLFLIFLKLFDQSVHRLEFCLQSEITTRISSLPASEVHPINRAQWPGWLGGTSTLP